MVAQDSDTRRIRYFIPPAKMENKVEESKVEETKLKKQIWRKKRWRKQRWKVILENELLIHYFLLFGVCQSYNDANEPIAIISFIKTVDIESFGILAHIAIVYLIQFHCSILFSCNIFIVYSNINFHMNLIFIPQKFNKSSGHNRRHFYYFLGL